MYGRDFVTEPRSTEARIERSRAIATELAALGVDVIVAAGPTLPGVKQAGIATSVVMIGAGDPAKSSAFLWRGRDRAVLGSFSCT